MSQNRKIDLSSIESNMLIVEEGFGEVMQILISRKAPPIAASYIMTRVICFLAIGFEATKEETRNNILDLFEMAWIDMKKMHDEVENDENEGSK